MSFYMSDLRNGATHMNFYDLQIMVEELNDGGDYQYLASSPICPLY